MVFDASAHMIGMHNPTAKMAEYTEADIAEQFLFALSEGDRKRFSALCRMPSDYSRIYGFMGTFRLRKFFRFTYASAKKGEEGDDRVYVTFFRQARDMNDFTSPTYAPFFSMLPGVEEQNVSLFSPSSVFIREHVPCLALPSTDHTDIAELTERMFGMLAEDPVFFGNRIELHLPDPTYRTENGGLLYTVRFSAAVYVHVLYGNICSI